MQHSPTAGFPRYRTSRPTPIPAVSQCGAACALFPNSIGGCHEHDA